MAMDEVTNKFYLITQMGSNNTNDGNTTTPGTTPDTSTDETTNGTNQTQ